MSDEYKASAVLFSGGLDSAVLLAQTAQDAVVEALYVSVGFAWEAEERAMAARLVNSVPLAGRVAQLRELSFDMRDVFPPTHWAVRGTPPASDTPDEDVYLHGRNIILLAKAAVSVAAETPRPFRLLMGQLAGNPFPDATPAFVASMAGALSLGLDRAIAIEMPFAAMRKSEVIRLGARLAVPFELTLSCMAPSGGMHCGRCSKCRERRDAFREAGVTDPARYRE